MPQEGKTDGVVVVADDRATWLAGLLAGAGRETLLQAQRAGIAAQLAVLDDANPAVMGRSSAEVRGVPINVLAEAPTGHLVQAIMLRGSGVRPLVALAGQLHHDVTQLQGQRIERALPNWGTRCRR
jgi:hypothetical protein